MTQKISRIFLVLFCCTLFFGFTTVYASTQRASDYFSYTEVVATPVGNGKFAVEFDINATHIMDKLGATEIIIWERQSNGSYESVKTYTSGLMDTNTAAAYGRVYYQGTSGARYYATVALYAKDSSGSETLYSNTSVITA